MVPCCLLSCWRFWTLQKPGERSSRFGSHSTMSYSKDSFITDCRATTRFLTIQSSPSPLFARPASLKEEWGSASIAIWDARGWNPEWNHVPWLHSHILLQGYAHICSSSPLARPASWVEEIIEVCTSIQSYLAKQLGWFRSANDFSQYYELPSILNATLFSRSGPMDDLNRALSAQLATEQVQCMLTLCMQKDFSDIGLNFHFWANLFFDETWCRDLISEILIYFEVFDCFTYK